MDTFDFAKLNRLSEESEGPLVSIYLPTNPAGRDGEQDAIRLKNLLKKVESKLSGHWMRSPDAEELLSQAARLPLDSSFWANRAKGMAIFVSPTLFEKYRVAVPLAEQAFVGSRFRLRPVLPLLEDNQSCFLLAISQNKVSFYSMDGRAIQPIEISNLPNNLAEALNYAGADRGSQTHSAMTGITGKQAAVFHGQGGQPDTSKAEQLAFCRNINNAVTSWLGESARPLLLACTEPIASLYRKKNSYQHLLANTFTGNHDYEASHELHRGAWQIAEPQLESASQHVATRYSNLCGTDRTSDDAAAIISGALQGRVDALLYDPKAELFGECSPDGGTLKVSGKADDEDLVDLAAIETLRHAGTIHSMTNQDLPTNAPMAAIFRY